MADRPSTPQPLAALVDWGTSALRVYAAEGGLSPRLLHADAAGGVTAQPPGDAAAFSAALERALAAAGVAACGGAVVACGMVGSSRGWQEAPYVQLLPGADAAASLAAGAIVLTSTVPPHRTVYVLPGLRSAGNANEADDIMRGEETQCLGAVAAAAADVLLLPGTHSKWVVLAAGGVASHTTFMTGELFALLSQSSILTTSVGSSAAADEAGRARAGDDAAKDDASFLEGARQPAPLAALFSVRTRDVLALPGEERAAVRARGAAFLSGALIAAELREAREWLARRGGSGCGRCGPGPCPHPPPVPRVLVIGAPALAARYVAALRQQEGWCEPALAADGAAAVGLARVAAALGLQVPAGGGCSSSALPPDAAALVLATAPVAPAAAAADEGSGVPAAEAATGPPAAAPAALHASRAARWQAALAAAPLVVILRGVTPEEAVAVGMAAAAGGARVIEVPLNSPRPLESIAALAAAFRGKPQVLVGAGTVLSPQDVAAAAAAGAELVLAPNADPAVIAAARALGMLTWPGVATATEALAALTAGASGLKLFPCTALSPATVRALRAVLPAGTGMLAVGGVDARNALEYTAAGAAAAGVGTALYAPGDAPATVEERVRAFLRAVAVGPGGRPGP